MKMTNIEKLFVNSPSHSQQVSLHAEKLLQRVEFEAGQTYLDVGCGNGAAVIYLAQKYGLSVTGVDVDPDQIRQTEASGTNLGRFLTVDGQRLPFEAGEFDIVATNKVMHHIPQWPQAVAEMIRVLKPGGYFIYSDLIYPGWAAALGQVVAKNWAGFPTRKGLDSLLKQHNLVKIYMNSGANYEVIGRKNNYSDVIARP